MKQACYTKSDAKQAAIKEMENCMAYLALGDKKMAAIHYGAASVYEEMLMDVFDVYLDEESEHYQAMLEIWAGQAE